MLSNKSGNKLDKWLAYEWLTLLVIINLAADRPVKDWVDGDIWDGLARDLASAIEAGELPAVKSKEESPGRLYKVTLPDLWAHVKDRGERWEPLRVFCKEWEAVRGTKYTEDLVPTGQDGGPTVNQKPDLPTDTDPVPHVPPEQPNIGGNDQRETQRPRSAGSEVRSKTRGKPGKRVGKYHKPMCAALDKLCSNHGLDKVADWDWTHLRQRIERHPQFKGGYTLPKESQFRKVCNEWFDKAAKSGKYQNDSR